MANAEAELQNAGSTGKSRISGLLLGLGLAVVLGGGGFYAVSSGMILGGAKEPPAVAATDASALPLPGTDVAFLPLEPIMITLGPNVAAEHLRFRAQLEVAPDMKAEVERLIPRIVDVLNAYLRAVDPAELADPGALGLLRAQMLRRIQIVTGDGPVRDLLISEFVLN